jgi:SAM-dependent methyltransferase
MHREFIAALRCPLTGSPLRVTAAIADPQGKLQFGVVTTEGGEFPLVAGVLRLLCDKLQYRLVDLIKAGSTDRALMTVLEAPAPSRWTTLVNRAGRLADRVTPSAGARIAQVGKQRLYELLTQPNVRFTEVASALDAGPWSNWQTYRFSMPTFLPVYALSHLASGCRTILDFGCGLGHSSFVMNRLAPDAQIVCADYSFTSLYLAKRFLVPNSLCVCLDGDYPLPFEDAAFDLVFSTDALQYIEMKIGLAREFQRIMKPEGVVALAHLHNSLSSRKTGTALTPSGYDGLFEGMRRRLYPEDEIVADYVAHGCLDLSRSFDRKALDAALGGVSLVAANSNAVFTRHDGLCDAYIDAMRHPHLNPIYRPRATDGAFALERGIGEPYAVARTIQGCELLPRTWTTDIRSVDPTSILALRGGDRAKLRELVRRFVVLDMPETFYA